MRLNRFGIYFVTAYVYLDVYILLLCHNRSENSSFEETTSTEDMASVKSDTTDILDKTTNVDGGNTTGGMRSGIEGGDDDCELTITRLIKDFHLQVEETRCLKYSQVGISLA